MRKAIILLALFPIFLTSCSDKNDNEIKKVDAGLENFITYKTYIGLNETKPYLLKFYGENKDFASDFDENNYKINTSADENLFFSISKDSLDYAKSCVFYLNVECVKKFDEILKIDNIEITTGEKIYKFESNFEFNYNEDFLVTSIKFGATYQTYNFIGNISSQNDWLIYDSSSYYYNDTFEKNLDGFTINKIYFLDVSDGIKDDFECCFSRDARNSHKTLENLNKSPSFTSYLDTFSFEKMEFPYTVSASEEFNEINFKFSHTINEDYIENPKFYFGSMCFDITHNGNNFTIYREIGYYL